MACGGGREDAALPTEEIESPTPSADESAPTTTVAEPPAGEGATADDDSSSSQAETSPQVTTTEGAEEEQADDARADAEPGGLESEAPPVTVGSDEGDATEEDPGLSVYTAAGCAACHGDLAQGTEIGPALPGHSAEVIMRQIRAPLGSMPAYGEDRLSDDQLELIVEFITSLAPEADHVEPLDLPGSLAVHHWMALIAIDADDIEDALHHVEHIAEVVEGDHREAMEQAANLLRQGEVPLAEDTIQDMLAGTADPELSIEELHLQLALSAIDSGDLEQAGHHLDDAAAATRGQMRRDVRSARELLAQNNVHDAQHAVQSLLGVGHG